MQEQNNLSERSCANASVDYINGAKSCPGVEGAKSDNRGLPSGYFEGGPGI